MIGLDGRPADPGPAAMAALWPVCQALVGAALAGSEDTALVTVFGSALVAAGLPLSAIEVRCDVVNTNRADRLIGWRADAGAREGSKAAGAIFQDMLRAGMAEWRLAGDLKTFRRKGATDAVAIASHLAPDVTLGFFDDVMSLFATERPGGFMDHEVVLLRRAMPVFALAIGARLNADAARALLQTYLGQNAATAMLGGRVSLGDVATIRAVVLYCDLVGFTTTTAALAPSALIGLLNRFFETVTQPVAAAGGQVSGHVGDAIVMYLPIAEPSRDRAICVAAIGAAMAGLQALQALDPAQRAKGEPPLRARIGIDIGDVVHGNVGSAGRFSFTIIGTAVNRAARLQALAKDLGAAVLMPAALAAATHLPCQALGRHILKGLDQAVDVVGLSLDD